MERPAGSAPVLPPVERSNRNHAFAASLLQELQRAGVAHVCICPGSRSAPLAVAALATPELARSVHVDERSAAFFALGFAKASSRPAALVCTSGSAPAHFLPALVEARLAKVPLVVLSADRPPELRDWGAPQTIDQGQLFGSQVRWFAEVPSPQTGTEALRYARALGARAVAEATGPPAGPVHLNLAFREPLDPRLQPEDFLQPEGNEAARSGRCGRPYTERWVCDSQLGARRHAQLVDLARKHRRVAIVCGPMGASPSLARAVARLARTAGWPVLAEPASQLRAGGHLDEDAVLVHGQLLLQASDFAAAHPPDWVLRIGALPTGKAVRSWLASPAGPRISLLDGDGAFSDPEHVVSEVIAADPEAVCGRLEAALRADPPAADPGWLEAFRRAEERAGAALARMLAAEPELLPAQVARTLFAGLPAGATLYLASGMAIRDADDFLPASRKEVRVLVNRGANGIDGLVSSALGAAASGAQPLVLWAGDLAFLHDFAALLTAQRLGLRATLLVGNDDGGAIFGHLPIAGFGESVAFDALFRVRHGHDLGALARACGAGYKRVTSRSQLERALGESLTAPGVQVVEVPLDPAAAREQRRRLEAAVAAELCGEGR